MLIYILHFAKPVAGKRHYVGSCEDTELNTRMRRHQLGTASRLTGLLHQSGQGFMIGALYQSQNRDLEKRIKRNKHYEQKCTICRQKDEGPSLFANVLYFPPVEPKNGDCTVSWTTQKL